MDDKPKSVVRSENFFDILALANSYADGKDIPGLEVFLNKAVRGKAKIVADRMAKRPSKIVSEAVRSNIIRAQDVLDNYAKSEKNGEEDAIPKLARVIAPEEASTIDGVIVKEIPAAAKVASEGKVTDFKDLLGKREHDRESEEGSSEKILPGNMHTEMMRMFDHDPDGHEASYGSDEELNKLYQA